VDKENRNCYNCGKFEHLAKNCRNRGIGNRIRKGKRLKYRKKRIIEEGNKSNSNLNRDQDLILLD